MLYERDLKYDTHRGVLPKWAHHDGHFFVKSSKKYKTLEGEYHIEAVMECIAYEVGKQLGVDVIPYHMDKLKLLDDQVIDVCVSPNYVLSRHISLPEPAEVVMTVITGSEEMPPISVRYKTLLDALPHVAPDIDKMIVFDFLIDNTDRHWENFEFYADGNGDYQLTPLYDHGSSLLSECLDDDELEHVLTDEEIYMSEIVYGDSYAKSFALEHSASLRLVDIKNIESLNWTIPDSAFQEIVSKYAPYLTTLRQRAILELLVKRFSRLKRVLLNKF